MDPKDRQLLNETHALAEENNKILRGMRRNARISGVFRIVYWIFILGSVYASYLYLSPLFASLGGGFQQLQDSLVSLQKAGQNIQNLDLPPELKKALENIQKGQ